jgi:hypothetical protein
MNPGQMALARMPCVPYSMAAAFVNPVDDRTASGGQHGPQPVLGAEQHAAQVDVHHAVVLVHRDLGDGLSTADASDVQHGVDLAEGLDRLGEHGLDLLFLGDVDPERHDGIPELLGRLLLATRDVGGQHLGPFPHEHLGRGPGHARPRPGDDRHLAVQFTHV